MANERTRVHEEAIAIAEELVALVARPFETLVSEMRAAPATSGTLLLRLVHLAGSIDPAGTRAVVSGRRVALPTRGGHIVADLSDWTTLVAGQRGWEPELVALCANHIRPGDTVLDVGAHVGMYAVAFADKVGAAGRVHAFEPMPDNVALLRSTVAYNDLVNTILVEEAAVTDRSGSAAMFTFRGDTTRHLGKSSMLYSLVQSDDYADTGIRVPLITLDEFARARDIDQVSFIKIDTEGSELGILEHARELIARSDRLALLVEVHPPELAALGASTEDVTRLLASLSFDVKTLACRGDGIEETGPTTHVLARER